MITESDKILRRAAHYCFDYRNEVYIWGGFMEYLPKVILSLFIIFHIHTTMFFNELQNIQDPKWPNTIPKNGNDLHSSQELLIYDPISKTFRIIKTGGDVPPRTLAPSGRVDQTYYISAKSLNYIHALQSSVGSRLQFSSRVDLDRLDLKNLDSTRLEST